MPEYVINTSEFDQVKGELEKQLGRRKISARKRQANFEKKVVR